MEKVINTKTKKVMDIIKTNKKTLTNKPCDTVEINPKKETPDRQTA